MTGLHFALLVLSLMTVGNALTMPMEVAGNRLIMSGRVVNGDLSRFTDLVKRWATLPNRNGLIYFFDPARLKRRDGISAFLCSGAETGGGYDDGEKVARSGYDLGIFTSGRLVMPNR
jgi:hypothetical protein